MQTFNLIIMTPETTLFEGNVLAAIFPGVDGSFEILHNHAPIIAMLKMGTVEITNEHKEQVPISIPSGFLEFQKNKGTLLCSPTKGVP